MAQANVQRAETSEGETTRGARPVATFKQGGVEVSVWRNPTDKGDMYNTTIRNSYKDDKSGEWKETTSFSPADLAVLAQLSGQAFQEIVQMKAQSRSR
jgi:hypothetical protein